MKRLLKLGIFAVAVALTSAPTLVQAFNSAAHVNIVDEVFSDCSRKIDLHYGSVAVDFSLFVSPTAAEDIHTISNLFPYARTSTQRCFAKGWITHALADLHSNAYIAIKAPLLLDRPKVIGYIYLYKWNKEQAGQLAHHAIEKAIDLLLKYDYPMLPRELQKAVLFRSWQDRFLLTKVFVLKEDIIDWSTLVGAELTFRILTYEYAKILALPNPLDKDELSVLGSQLAAQLFEVEVPSEVFLDILNEAIGLCAEDYMDPIDDAIDGIRAALGLP